MRFLTKWIEGAKRKHESFACKAQVSINNDERGAEAKNNEGKDIFLSGDYEGALRCFDLALVINPDYVPALCNRGVALKSLKRPEDALFSFRAALEINSGDEKVHYNMGLTFLDLGERDAALKCFDAALAIKSNYAEAYSSRGAVLNDLNRLGEAIASFEAALAIKPDYAEAHNNIGVLRYKLKRFGEALSSYSRAISLKPDYASAYNNRGAVFDSMSRFDEALDDYNRAIALKPDYADAYNNRGSLFECMKRYDEALESYSRAITLAPNYEFLYGQWIDAKAQLCDWKDYDIQIMGLAERIERGDKAASPFVVLSRLHSRKLQKRAAEIYVLNKCPENNRLKNAPVCSRRDKIRVGYFSADFCNHPVSFLTAELFELHDRSKFEIIAFSFGSNIKDDMSLRVFGAFDQIHVVREKSDEEVAMLARSLEIDIAIDLGGFTTDSRPGIFALRAAPLQVSYLGYLGTMGAEYIDYLIADDAIIPDSHRVDYAEKVIYLPSYQVNDTKRVVSDIRYSRSDLYLPDSGFVFCCFNNSYKITPNVFEGWMRILKRVEGAVLWLLGDVESVKNNLRAEALQRGVDPRRLVFAQRLPVAEYLARYRNADLFLDTSPYNAGTTASDALWMGVPVLTFLGETFAARVAASLLRAIDLPELITTSQEEYEALAVRLATQPEILIAIKRKLLDNRLTTRLFDTKRFCNTIEEAYGQIYERNKSGLLPDHVFIN